MTNDHDPEGVWCALAQATRHLAEAPAFLLEARRYGGDKDLIAESQHAIGMASGPVRGYMTRLEEVAA